LQTHRRWPDNSTKSVSRQNFIVLLVAPPEPKFGELGEAALGVIGPSQWETGANYNINMAMGADVEWFGPSGTDFIASYRKKYEEEPSYHAAGGYVAGLILQKAIVKAGVLDNSHLLETLDGLDMMTFFGQIRFETEPTNMVSRSS
jgi:branched-chain amino acid transport system substrate-binding protein